MSLDFALFRAVNNFDGDDNGGRESNVQIADDEISSIFPPVLVSEEGPIDRKIFLRNNLSGSKGLNNVRVWAWWENPANPSSSVVRFEMMRRNAEHSATKGDTYFADTAYHRYFLREDASAGDTIIYLETRFIESIQEWEAPAYYPGDEVVISSSITDDDGGPFEFGIVDESLDGGRVRLREPIQNNYSKTFNVGSVTYKSYMVHTFPMGEVSGKTKNETYNSANGSYAFHLVPIVVENLGSVYDTITLTFSSSSQFNAQGEYLGNLGSGNIYSDFSPINPETGTPYFTVKKSGWRGTWANVDEMSFTVVPSSRPIWLFYWPGASNGRISRRDKLILRVYGEHY